jgi:hypothetical protein
MYMPFRERPGQPYLQISLLHVSTTAGNAATDHRKGRYAYAVSAGVPATVLKHGPYPSRTDQND